MCCIFYTDTEDSITALLAVDEELRSSIISVDNRLTTVNYTLSQGLDEVNNSLDVLDSTVDSLDQRVSQLEVTGKN